MKNLQIEALFGGVLAMVVLGVAIYAIANTNFTNVTGDPNADPQYVAVEGDPVIFKASTGQDLICECYDKGFDLAAKSKVISPEYRTGFEQCRARGGVDGGEAWTAGWNARLSAKPYEASCRAYKRRD